ncbi:hypothetical protein HPP92_007107 [Vanilla planifolia]|uniref:Uncharacterized protein n=1 Tax=Vanilla planifolia TaxID=51239 RepID=A0A835RFQ8_VANPL|nr:hypothetical protein HPP92_007107 [Vanilla planifolia]
MYQTLFAGYQARGRDLCPYSSFVFLCASFSGAEAERSVQAVEQGYLASLSLSGSFVS